MPAPTRGTVLVACTLVTLLAAGLARRALRSPHEAATRRPPTGPEVEQAVFADWHDPYGAEVPRTVLDGLWDAIGRMDSEPPPVRGGGVGSWETIGPRTHQAAAFSPEQDYWSGRIRDIEVLSGLNHYRVAAASGGIWEVNGDLGHPVPISDQLESLSFGSFDSDPTDADHILAGTGEPYTRTGAGLWRTFDGGASWTQIPMSGMSTEPEGFYRLRFHPQDPTRVLAATTKGRYLSTDSGETWTWQTSGIWTDVAFCETPARVFMVRGYDATAAGLYVSTNAGDTWSPVAHPVLPGSAVGRGSLSVGPSNDPSIRAVWYSVAVASDSANMLGVYRSPDSGVSWFDVTPPPDNSFTAGWYANSISADPIFPETAFLGWVWPWLTTDTGASWTKLTSFHGDQQFHTWDGPTDMLVNDGGLVQTVASPGLPLVPVWFPITQFYNLDVDPTDSEIALGGIQDMGLSRTIALINDGGYWFWKRGGDGGGIVIHPTGSPWYAVNGPEAGSLWWRNLRSTDQGDTWTDTNNGLPASTQFGRRVRMSRSPAGGANLYTHVLSQVFRSTDDGDNWTSINGAGFDSQVADLMVADAAGTKLWVVTTSSDAADDRALFWDGSVWNDVDPGLPPTGRVRKIVPADRYGASPQKAYALMTGADADVLGQKVFRTTDSGQSWTNLTGVSPDELPNVFLSDLLEHPSNADFLYAVSEQGAFRTTDGGTTWHTFNNGWPRAVIVKELVPVIDPGPPASFSIYAATFGRSLYRRNVTRDVLVSTSAPARPAAGGLRLAAGPNPFRGGTVLSFEAGEGEPVRLEIVDVAGRRVRDLGRAEPAAGTHRVTWDGRDDAGAPVAAGVYWARATSGDRTDRVRLTLLR